MGASSIMHQLLRTCFYLLVLSFEPPTVAGRAAANIAEPVEVALSFGALDAAWTGDLNKMKTLIQENPSLKKTCYRFTRCIMCSNTGWFENPTPYDDVIETKACEKGYYGKDYQRWESKGYLKQSLVGLSILNSHDKLVNYLIANGVSLDRKDYLFAVWTLCI